MSEWPELPGSGPGPGGGGGDGGEGLGHTKKSNTGGRLDPVPDAINRRPSVQVKVWPETALLTGFFFQLTCRNTGKRLATHQILPAAWDLTVWILTLISRLVSQTFLEKDQILLAGTTQ